MDDIKEWYILIGGQQEGPYSVTDLKVDHRVSSDTLVWKEGMGDWVPAGVVVELQELFVDHGEGEEGKEPEKPEGEEFPTRITPDGLVIDMRAQPPHLLMWIVVLVLVIIYFVFRYQ